MMIHLHSNFENYEFSPTSALKKFYDSSSQYRPPLKDYPSLIGYPLNDDEMSVGINAYNDKLNPHLSVWGCAACGIQEISGDQHTLKISELSNLMLTEDEFSNYENVSPKYRPCFNIIVVYILGVAKGFYLNSHFVTKSHSMSPVEQHYKLSDNASLCTPCFHTLGKKNPTIPKFSIASGYDFGHPLKAGLKPLTTLERKLISKNILFATIIKLVASNGNHTPQHGLKGHIIAMPHQGAHLAAAVILPNIVSIQRHNKCHVCWISRAVANNSWQIWRKHSVPTSSWTINLFSKLELMLSLLGCTHLKL